MAVSLPEPAAVNSEGGVGLWGRVESAAAPALHRPLLHGLARDICCTLDLGPQGNDTVPVERCHMQYTSVLEAAAIIGGLGQGTLLAKIDLHQAYRMVPVHADDHRLLGIQWREDIFVDTALPFGLRSARKIFSAFSDALAGVLYDRGVAWQLHYLDDFLLMGTPGSQSCARSLQTTIDSCKQLGVPVATHKTEGPATTLTFLGIQINTQDMTLSLPDNKLTHIMGLILSWRGKQTATKRVFNRAPEPRGHGSYARANIFKADDRPHEDGKAAETLYQTDSRVQVRSSLVGLLPPIVEWAVHHASSDTYARCDIGRLRVMGL